MAGKRRSHSETFWATARPGVVRCNASRPNGEQCKREAEPGSVVCDQHGGAAPQVRRRAAERVMMTADAAAEAIIAIMHDTAQPVGVRLKAAQDMLDRAGLAGKQVIEVGPKADDPIERLFLDILEDPEGLSQPPAIEAGPIVQGQIVDPAQDAVDRLAESWQPDAEVHTIHRPEDYGPRGPHKMRNPAKPPRHIADGLGL